MLNYLVIQVTYAFKTYNLIIFLLYMRPKLGIKVEKSGLMEKSYKYHLLIEIYGTSIA